MENKTHLLVHILEKVDKIEEHVSVMRVDQAEMRTDLKYHIRRTDLLESQVKEGRKALDVMVWPFRLLCTLLRFFRIIK